MVFPLEVRDEWPPVTAESLWVRRISEHEFAVDNVPFFVKNLALQDRVVGRIDADGRLLYDRKVAGGGHSTIRVIFLREESRSQREAELVAMGCRLERSPWRSLIALDMASGDEAPIVTHLQAYAEQEVLEYEVGCGAS